MLTSGPSSSTAALSAVTHLARLERLQHRFLMWLGAKTQQTPPHIDYHSLLQYFTTDSIKARLIHADIMFLHNVFHHRIDSDHLLSMFGLNVPGRRNRRTGLFHIPVASAQPVCRLLLFVSVLQA